MAQGVERAQAARGFGVHPALNQHGRGTPQRLQTAGLLLALALRAAFCQPSWGQALAGTRQARTDRLVLMGQKKGRNRLVLRSHLLEQRQPLAQQDQHPDG
jgi:hypothetical protein